MEKVPRSRCSRRSLIMGAVGLPLLGQDETVFSTDVKVVNILANVRGRNGEVVRDLRKEEFSVRENGRPQTIRYFSRDTDLPLTIGLMVDTSMSQRRVLDAERGASLQFLDSVLRENKDKVFIMQFDMGVQMRQGLLNRGGNWMKRWRLWIHRRGGSFRNRTGVAR